MEPITSILALQRDPNVTYRLVILAGCGPDDFETAVGTADEYFRALLNHRVNFRRVNARVCCQHDGCFKYTESGSGVLACREFTAGEIKAGVIVYKRALAEEWDRAKETGERVVILVCGYKAKAIVTADDELGRMIKDKAEGQLVFEAKHPSRWNHVACRTVESIYFLLTRFMKMSGDIADAVLATKSSAQQERCFGGINMSDAQKASWASNTGVRYLSYFSTTNVFIVSTPEVLLKTGKFQWSYSFPVMSRDTLPDEAVQCAEKMEHYLQHPEETESLPAAPEDGRTTTTQADALGLLWGGGHKTQNEIAKTLGVAPSRVTNALQAERSTIDAVDHQILEAFFANFDDIDKVIATTKSKGAAAVHDIFVQAIATSIGRSLDFTRQRLTAIHQNKDHAFSFTELDGFKSALKKLDSTTNLPRSAIAILLGVGVGTVSTACSSIGLGVKKLGPRATSDEKTMMMHMCKLGIKKDIVGKFFGKSQAAVSKVTAALSQPDHDANIDDLKNAYLDAFTAAASASSDDDVAKTVAQHLGIPEEFVQERLSCIPSSVIVLMTALEVSSRMFDKISHGILPGPSAPSMRNIKMTGTNKLPYVVISIKGTKYRCPSGPSLEVVVEQRDAVEAAMKRSPDEAIELIKEMNAAAPPKKKRSC